VSNDRRRPPPFPEGDGDVSPRGGDDARGSTSSNLPVDDAHPMCRRRRGGDDGDDGGGSTNGVDWTRAVEAGRGYEQSTRRLGNELDERERGGSRLLMEDGSDAMLSGC